MTASALLGLPLFGGTSPESVPQNDDTAELAHLEAVARSIVISSFAWYQDEEAMSFYFRLRQAAQKIYGKNREIDGKLPPQILEHIRLAGDAGSKAMHAAEYREDTNAELNDRINEWTAEIAKPTKKHGGKKARRKVAAEGFEDEPGDDDENRRILQEWLQIALEERARRDRIANFDHLADMEQRAREKFGDDGLALMQRYVAQAMACEDDAWNGDDEILVDGKCLPIAYEAMQSLRQGDAGAAERFVGVLAKARIDQGTGYPNGVTVAFAPRSAPETWAPEQCRAFVEAIPGGIAINGVTLDLSKYNVSHEEFPVRYAITPDKSQAWWTQQFSDALAAASSEQERALLDSMDFARIDVPIVAVLHSGVWHIIDGKKRLASRFYGRLSRVPAIWVVPKLQPRSFDGGRQAQLLDYENEDLDLEDETD